MRALFIELHPNYNRMTANYNERLQAIPSNVVASMFNFQKRDLFEIEDPAAREVPEVSF